jgi:cell division protein ZapE
MTDYRQDRLAGNPVYFTPLDKGARAALNEIWRDLTHGREEELVLEVKGRAVICRATGRAWRAAPSGSCAASPLGPATTSRWWGGEASGAGGTSRSSTRRTSTRPSAS